MSQFRGDSVNVITISKKKFETLEPLKLSRGVFNTEAEIYDFPYRGQIKVLKRLFHQSGEVFANKLYTLEMLDAYKEYLPDNFCVPDSLISVNGSIEGFTIPKKEGSTLVSLLKDLSVDSTEQIHYLKKVGSILQHLHVIRKYTPLNDFYLNDIHDSNFIVNPNNRELTVIDLDSCKIKNNEAFPSRYLTPYSLLNNVKSKYKINQDGTLGYVTADEQSDLYCYVMMILNYLYGENIDSVSIDEFYEYLNYLEDIGVNQELVDNFGRVVINKPNENPVNYLDTLTRENVFRAKKNVYKKVKKR